MKAAAVEQEEQQHDEQHPQGHREGKEEVDRGAREPREGDSTFRLAREDVEVEREEFVKVVDLLDLLRPGKL